MSKFSKISSFYKNGIYLSKNPLLHSEDSLWKTKKIIPLVDILMKHLKNKEITILDAGGGAGIILNKIANYITKKYNLKVNKFILDLNAEMLKIQKKNNPDIKKVVLGDIRNTPFREKEIDLVLMIDVLEHIPEPKKALKEIKRISKYAIFKVPLENNYGNTIQEKIDSGISRRKCIDEIGHINIYNFSQLKEEIESNYGIIINSNFTNVFQYNNHSKTWKKKSSLYKRVKNYIAMIVYFLSPRICSLLFLDFAIILASNRLS